jgi:glycosyltransferase involved in cell wall biosynthesis
LRILLIIKNFDFGGAENHVRELANTLSDSGNEVYVIAGNGRQKSLLNKRVNHISMTLKYMLIPFSLIRISFMIRRHKIQVIHAHQRLPILTSCLAGRITGVPVIVTVHGRTRFDLRSRLSRKYPDRIIFVSRKVLEVSAKYEDIKEKSVIIPNWVSDGEKRADSIPYSICYVSRIDKKHSELILLIIKTISRLSRKYPSVRFRIIGEGDYLNKVREEAALINSRLNREACKTEGFVLDVKGMIWQSELVIGVGRVALEALAVGVPVLSMNRRRMGSLISRGNYETYRRGNFVAAGNDPPDETSLFNSLDDFFEHRDIWKQETSVLKEYVLRDFSPEKITGEIMKLYHEVSE